MTHRDWTPTDQADAADANDNRCGSAGSLEDAKLEIDMILEDWG